MTTIAALATSMVMATSSPSSEERAVYVPTRIEVGTESLTAGSTPEDLPADRRAAQELRERVVTRLGHALRERHVPVGATFDGAVVRVDLRWKENRGSHYLVSVAVERGGRPLRVTDALECVSCDGARLAEVLVAQVPALLVRLEVAAEPGPAPAADVTDHGSGSMVEPESEPEPMVEPRDRAPRTLGPVGYGGIAALVAGAAGIIGGAVLLARGERRSLEPDHRLQRIDDYRPAGGALVGVAGVVVAAGVGLVVVDAVVLRRRRGSTSSRGRVHPMLGAGTGGVGFTTRF